MVLLLSVFLTVLLATHKAVFRPRCVRHCGVIWIWMKWPKYFHGMSSSEYYPKWKNSWICYAWDITSLRFLKAVVIYVTVECFCSGDSVCLLPVMWTKEPKIPIWFYCFPWLPFSSSTSRLWVHFQMLILCLLYIGYFWTGMQSTSRWTWHLNMTLHFR